MAQLSSESWPRSNFKPNKIVVPIIARITGQWPHTFRNFLVLRFSKEKVMPKLIAFYETS